MQGDRIKIAHSIEPGLVGVHFSRLERLAKDRLGQTVIGSYESDDYFEVTEGSIEPLSVAEIYETSALDLFRAKELKLSMLHVAGMEGSLNHMHNRLKANKKKKRGNKPGDLPWSHEGLAGYLKECFPIKSLEFDKIVVESGKEDEPLIAPLALHVRCPKNDEYDLQSIQNRMYFEAQEFCIDAVSKLIGRVGRSKLTIQQFDSIRIGEIDLQNTSIDQVERFERSAQNIMPLILDVNNISLDYKQS